MRKIWRYMVTGWVLLLAAGCALDNGLPPTVPAAPTAAVIKATMSPTAPPTRVPMTQTPSVTADCGQTGQHACSSDVTWMAGKLSQSERMRYLLYLPGDYGKEKARKWPLVLFLHGSGEAGTDLNLLRDEPLPGLLERNTDFPFIVVSPQIPAPGADTQSQQVMRDPQEYVAIWGWNSWIERLNLLLDDLEKDYAIDTRQEYLTGLSLGGFGAWNYALRSPERFAALVPIAGGYEFGHETLPEDVCRLKDLPIWAFHGSEDSTVESWQSQLLVDALTACGGNVRLTLYPAVGHEAWRQAYADPALWEWLLKQKH